MSLVATLAVIAVCLLMEAFFSGSEIGVVSADPMKLRHQAAKGSKGARLALKMLERPEWLLSTTLIGTNIAVVTNTTIAAALMIELFGDHGRWMAIAVVAPLIWIFGEIVPKSVFQQKADAVTAYSIFPLRAAYYLFYPLLLVFTSLTRLLSRAVGEKPRNPFSLRKELRAMLQMPATEGDIQPSEKSMIRRLFDFSETTAREVMVPWVDVAVVAENKSCGEAARLAVESGHQRLLVYSGRVDRAVGVLDTLELLGCDPEAPLRPFIRAVDYVPGSKSIRDLLLELRERGPDISVVVDEFGGAEGIVTLEDIVEEVVDEIEDEFDRGETSQWVRKLGDQHYLMSARVELDTLQELTGLKLPGGKYATVAGFLLELARDIPEQGRMIRYRDVTFTIQRVTPQALQEIDVRW